MLDLRTSFRFGWGKSLRYPSLTVVIFDGVNNELKFANFPNSYNQRISNKRPLPMWFPNRTSKSFYFRSVSHLNLDIMTKFGKNRFENNDGKMGKYAWQQSTVNSFFLQFWLRKYSFYGAKIILILQFNEIPVAEDVRLTFGATSVTQHAWFVKYCDGLGRERFYNRCKFIFEITYWIDDCETVQLPRHTIFPSRQSLRNIWIQSLLIHQVMF